MIKVNLYVELTIYESLIFIRVYQGDRFHIYLLENEFDDETFLSISCPHDNFCGL